MKKENFARYAVVSTVLFNETESLAESAVTFPAPNGDFVHFVVARDPDDAMSQALEQVPGGSPEEFAVMTEDAYRHAVKCGLPDWLWWPLADASKTWPRSEAGPESVWGADQAPLPLVRAETPATAPEPSVPESAQLAFPAVAQMPAVAGKHPGPALPAPEYVIVSHARFDDLVAERRGGLKPAARRRFCEGSVLADAMVREPGSARPLVVRAHSPAQALYLARLRRAIKNAYGHSAFKKEDAKALAGIRAVAWPSARTLEEIAHNARAAEARQIDLFSP